LLEAMLPELLYTCLAFGEFRGYFESRSRAPVYRDDTTPSVCDYEDDEPF